MTTGNSTVSTGDLVPISELASAGIEHADEVIELAERAQAYLGSMSWCDRIVNGWLGEAWGYILGAFYFEMVPSQPDVLSFIWIVVGDVPPAYISDEYASTSLEVIEGYVAEMQEWVDRVLSGRPIDDSVIPVNVPPEKVWAERLGARLNLIRSEVLGAGT